MAFGESWLISVMMRFTSNGSRVMSEVAGSTRALEGNLTKAQRALAKFDSATIAMGTNISRNFAMASASVAAFATVSAAQFQRTMTAIRNETGADPRKMGSVYNSVFDIANRAGMSPNTAGRAWLDVSRLTAGQLSIAQMRQIAPQVLDFASMINFNRPDVSVDDATKAGLQLVHLFRAYKPAQMTPLLDQVYRLSGLMAENPGQAVRQMSYYEPLFKGLGIDNNTSVAMMALLDRAGFRQKVGTNVRAAMLEALGPLQLTKHAQAGKLDMLEQMGVFKNGKFAWNRPDGGTDFIGMLTSVAEWGQRRRDRGVPSTELAKVLFGTFGRQGGNIMQLMAEPMMLQILAQIRAYQKNPNVSLAAGERNREDTLSFQAGRAWGNLQAVLTELGYRDLPQLTTGFKNVANTMHGFQEWLHAHRQAEDWIVGGLAWMTALSSARVALGGFGKLAKLAGLARGLEGLTGTAKALRFLDNVVTAGMVTKLFNYGKAITGIDIAASASLGPLAGVAAAINTIGGVATAFMNSAIGRVIKWGGSEVLAGFQISMSQQSNATATYNAMAKKYGVKYANYLSHGGPGGGGIGGWPWNFDPVGTKGGYTMPRGAMPPKENITKSELLDALKGGSGGKVDIHQSFTVQLAPGTTPAQARQIVQSAMDGIRSSIRASGNRIVDPTVPRAHQLDLSSPTLGLGQ